MAWSLLIDCRCGWDCDGAGPKGIGVVEREAGFGAPDDGRVGGAGELGGMVAAAQR